MPLGGCLCCTARVSFSAAGCVVDVCRIRRRLIWRLLWWANFVCHAVLVHSTSTGAFVVFLPFVGGCRLLSALWAANLV